MVDSCGITRLSIKKIDNNCQVVDSSLKDQEMMVVRFFKSVQKKKTKQNKRKEKRKKQQKIKRPPNKQTRKQRKGTISEDDNFIGCKETENGVVVSRQRVVATTYSIF